MLVRRELRIYVKVFPRRNSQNADLTFGRVRSRGIIFYLTGMEEE